MINSGIPAALKNVLLKHSVDAVWQQKKEEAEIRNPWFTQNNINAAINAWAESLSEDKVSRWLGTYELRPALSGKTVGVIMAGNLPLVGLHDLLCVLLAGHNIRIKLSKDDEVLMKHLVSLLIAEVPDLDSRIEFSENFKGLDAAIATGSNNSNRYFEYYFRHIPHLLRGHRNGVAVLSGNESEKDFIALGEDVFRFFGLGCRNVTHVFLPQGQSLEPMCRAWENNCFEVIHHHKYANNYNYHKSLLLMNLDPHLDLGFVLLKETADLYAPVGIVGFSYYAKPEDYLNVIEANRSKIQVVVSSGLTPDSVDFGHAQEPELWDYADGVDTLAWLLTF
jgi:hypothetical protein